jgi:hypothetical protein
VNACGVRVHGNLEEERRKFFLMESFGIWAMLYIFIFIFIIYIIYILVVQNIWCRKRIEDSLRKGNVGVECAKNEGAGNLAPEGFAGMLVHFTIDRF